MSGTPTWYDVLGVDRDASADEVTAAWRAGTADLAPGDRRFDTLNRAARVLLDPEQRAAYDAGLEDEDEDAPEEERSQDVPPPPLAPREDQPAATTGDTERARPTGGVPTWMLAALAALAVVMVAATWWFWSQEGEASEEAAREAQAAAEQAVVPVLSYDHRSLESDADEARSHLTEDYREEYDELFAVIEDNAPSTKTAVSVEVAASGIVRSGEDRVDVLVFVDRPTTNKLNPTPVVYRDQVTMTMEKVGEEWLVDEMKTSPTQE